MFAGARPTHPNCPVNLHTPLWEGRKRKSALKLSSSFPNKSVFGSDLKIEFVEIVDKVLPTFEACLVLMCGSKCTTSVIYKIVRIWSWPLRETICVCVPRLIVKMAHKDIIGDVIVKINSKILEPAELKKLDKLEKEQIHGQASTNKGKVESTTKQCLRIFKMFLCK